MTAEVCPNGGAGRGGGVGGRGRERERGRGRGVRPWDWEHCGRHSTFFVLYAKSLR